MDDRKPWMVSADANTQFNHFIPQQPFHNTKGNEMKAAFSVVVGLFIIGLGSTPALAQFAGGSGTTTYPYQISTVEQLQAMNTNLNAHYVLINDIDASVTSSWNSGAGFKPIGHHWSPCFRGSLDGQGYTITDLYMNRPPPTGLFGCMQYGTVRDVALEDADVTGIPLGDGRSWTGALAGYIHQSTITGCSTSGSVVGGKFVGGLVGSSYLYNQIGNSHATCTVAGISELGGLVGICNRSAITDSSATGTVTGERRIGGLVGESIYRTNIVNSEAACTVEGEGVVGGLVGNNYRSDITDSSATGTVTGTGWVGGLVGQNGASGFPSGIRIANCHADCTVDGEQQVGGLIGRNSYYSHVEDSSATGSVHGHRWVGGLLGSNYYYNSIVNSHADCTVEGQQYQIGGLVGGNEVNTTIRGCSSSGAVTAGGGGEPTYRVGGLVGQNYNNTTILESHSTSTVTGQMDPDHAEMASYVGGLTGYSGAGATISDSYATGSVIGSDAVGGLAGRTWSGVTVTRSYATGDATGVSRVGGLSGTSSQDCTITESLATGDVTGTEEVGGLAGTLYYGSMLEDCYATGDVSGVPLGSGAAEEPPTKIGGLAGALWESSAVSNSYSNGAVSSSYLTIPPEYVGGLIGWREDEDCTWSSSYWDTETSGQSTSDGGTGKTTEEMVQQATFVSWDFVDVWSIAEGWTYPYFPWGPVEEVRFSSLMDAVMDLVESGDLTHGNGNALNQKLSNAMDHLEKGDTKQACNMLQAFVNQVCGLIAEGSLTEADGSALIEEAHAIMEDIGCNRIRGCE